MAWNPFSKMLSKEKKSAPARVVEPRPDDSAAPAAVRFAFKLLSQAWMQSPQANLFLSPASISLALSMVYNGAAGETKEEMARTLELGGMSDEDANTGNKIIQALLNYKEDKVELAIANSLWSKTGSPFRPEFVKAAREYFSAEARELDFEAPGAAEVINGWVSEKTRGKISGIVSERALKASLLVLINALYFKGAWAEGFEFKRKATQDEPFNLLNGKTKSVPMMRQGNEFQYIANDRYQAIKLPYDERISMIVMLPAKGCDFSEFVKTVSAGEWESALKKMDSHPGTLSLPRFKIEYEIDLNECLGALGMGRAFTDQAQFSPMAEKPMMIGVVKHKTFVDVNEEGTEAAAVTAVMMAAGCAPSEPKPPFKMVVDRPFLCALRDERTATLLFLGAIVDP